MACGQKKKDVERRTAASSEPMELGKYRCPIGCAKDQCEALSEGEIDRKRTGSERAATKPN